MRNEISKNYPNMVRGMSRMLFIMLISLVWTTANAQRPVSADPRDPFNQYCEKHKNEVYVQFYLNNPNDVDAYSAIKAGMMIDNQELYQVSEQDAKILQEKFNASKMAVEAVDQKVKSGMTYDAARSSYDHEMEAKARMNKTTLGGKTPESTTSKSGQGENFTPTLSVPNQ